MVWKDWTLVKKNKLIIPKKVSYHDIKRECEKLKKQVFTINNKEKRNFDTLFVLAINLYKLAPDHEMFTNGTFTDEFFELLKKAAEKSKINKSKTEEGKDAG